ncbi:MAG: acyl-CoA dehydrogenase family protein [Casimicrobiaceae bacterium]|nr:acyl-CoA dehydrogenase family protein [Casimicrobiaceae bacterium]MDW8312437.1 acyl-CoA dehydrogenase family protein [Burkholderiales bacterium]
MWVTHRVENQPEPLEDFDAFAAHRPLREALAALAPGLDRSAEEALSRLGRTVGSAQMIEHARLANTHRPVLLTHDRYGRRIDRVEFHPSYHILLGQAIEAGLATRPWFDPRPHAHLRRAAAFMLASELDPSVLCPVSMSYAVVPALAGNAALEAALRPTLARGEYDPSLRPLSEKRGLTFGMGMTEKQGGSDVRANTTRAELDGEDAWGERHRLTGHKWFFSAPMSDAFLVLAQRPEGLTCFFLPRILPDGSANTLLIQRLKDKLGNHANASAEVEFADTFAWRVGEAGRGVQQILRMGVLTRLDCAAGTAGLMHAALSLAIDHARQRFAFGRRLVEQELMQQVLADLALESEAATVLVLRLASALDRGTDAHEAAVARLLTPLAKFWICKRGALFAQEAMECLGGNGYVEEGGRGVMARIYREMPLNSIWEGAGNLMALDLLRALRQTEARSVLDREFEAARGAHPALDRAREALPAWLDELAEEAQARRLALRLTLLWQAALLVRFAPAWVAEAFCATRLAEGAPPVFGVLPRGVNRAALIERSRPR